MFYLLLGNEMQQQTKIYTLKSGQNFVKKKTVFQGWYRICTINIWEGKQFSTLTAVRLALYSLIETEDQLNSGISHQCGNLSKECTKFLEC